MILNLGSFHINTYKVGCLSKLARASGASKAGLEISREQAFTLDFHYFPLPEMPGEQLFSPYFSTSRVSLNSEAQRQVEMNSNGRKLLRARLCFKTLACVVWGWGSQVELRETCYLMEV